MSDITPATRPSDPTHVVVQCITAAILDGVPVSADPYPGVVLASTQKPAWARDPASETVSALGAVLLIRQPPVADVDAALELALGVGPGWLVGFERGVLGHDMDERLERRPDARLVGQGVVAGQEVRARMHVRRLGTPVKIGVPTAGPARAVIAELLDALSTSQLLEAAADSCHGRVKGLTPEVAAAVTEIETVLRNLAEVMRRSGMGV
jgi:hypothetical protein